MNNHYENYDVDFLYSAVWGEGIHFGTYTDGQESIPDAACATRDRMMSLVDTGSANLVLEVGSGHGVTARQLAGRIGGRIVATNYAPNHNEVAIANTARAGLEHCISHGLADYHALPFFDNMFDLYWCQESFVHSTDKKRLMKEAYRVLAPGGKIIFSDQTTNRKQCLPEDSERIARRHGAPDLCDAEDFAELLQTAGFEEIRISDWSSHMTKHFEKLVDRMDATWDTLAASIDRNVLESNYENWCTAARYSRQGKMGWHCFLAHKPR